MVAQNSHHSFLRKNHKFIDDNNSPERHRSGGVQVTFRLRSDVVQKTVQARSTQANPSRPYLVIGHMDRLEKVARPEPSCEFHKIHYKIFSVRKTGTHEHRTNMEIRS
jgi:hypothetical protein